MQIEGAEAKKRPYPEWYLDEPEVFPTDEFYFRAFNFLSSSREMGMGMGPIPWKDIVHYAQWKNYPEEEALCVIIQLMDSAWLAWQNG